MPFEKGRAKTGSGANERLWVIVEYQGLWEWVISDRLRSRQQFEQQALSKPIELIREP